MLKTVRASEQYRDIPFLMVTAEVEEGTVAESIEADVDGYILKPFVPKTLEDKMIEILKKKLAPSPFEINLRQAEKQLVLGHIPEAHKFLDEAAKTSPKNPKIHFTRGLLFEAAGDLAKAEIAYMTARQVGPKFIKAHEKLAELYGRKGDAAKQLTMIREAVRVSPKNAERQTKLGEALLAGGREQEAKKAFNNALKIDPDDPKRKGSHWRGLPGSRPVRRSGESLQIVPDFRSLQYPRV